MENEGIIRNKLKITSAIENAKVFIRIRKECGSFDRYIWSFAGDKPLVSDYKSYKRIPSKTWLADTISKDLKKKGDEIRRLDNSLRILAGDWHRKRP